MEEGGIELTREERQLRCLFRIWTGLFGFGALYFLLFGRWLLIQVNFVSQEILRLDLPLIPAPVQNFWITLTVSLMVLLTLLSWQIQRDVRHRSFLVEAVLFAKLTSTACFLAWYFVQAPYFAYLLGSVFCDGPIFLITLIFYLRARRSVIRQSK